MTKRCSWVKMNNPLYIAYHDEGVGQPSMMTKHCLSCCVWKPIRLACLGKRYSNKRQAFREAFHGYQIHAVAEMTDTELEALLENPAIIRNRAKIFATR